jgi:hypothetical protein
MKKLIIIVAFLALSAAGKNSLIFGQSSGNSNVNITTTLVRGLTLTTYGSNTLDFGEIVVTGSSQTVQISNEDGQVFHATGHPWRTVILSYSTSITLNNNAWVAVNGGTQSTLTFTSNIADGYYEPTYVSNPVPTGTEGYLVPDVSGVGQGYLWIGGEITIDANQAPGNYIGQLSVSIAYN